MDQNAYESPSEQANPSHKPRLPCAVRIAGGIIGFMVAVASIDWLIFKYIELRTLSDHGH